MTTATDDTKKSFWKSSTGHILKIAGLIGAVTTLVGFGVQTYSYFTGFSDNRSKEKITLVIKEYYRLDSIQQCEQMAGLFVPVVEDYFNQSNLTQQQLVNSCVAYRNKWSYYRNNPDYQTLSTRQTDDGNYFASFHLLYKTKKKVNDNWKAYSLVIDMELDKEFKIKSIYEKKQ